MAPIKVTPDMVERAIAQTDWAAQDAAGFPRTSPSPIARIRHKWRTARNRFRKAWQQLLTPSRL